jgi:hypothetical protein
MRTASRRVLATLIVGLTAAVLVPGPAASQPPRNPAYYQGEVVFFLIPSTQVFGVDQIPDHVSLPLYFFPGPRRQFDVIGVAPGDAGYNPWWRVFVVIPLDGRDVSVDPFTSEQEILDAAAAGTVRLIRTNVVFLCQIVGGAPH